MPSPINPSAPLAAVIEEINTSTRGASVGFYTVAPVARPTAYTQTFATAARTHAAATAVAVATTGATSTTPFGYTLAAQANAIPVAINALIVDVDNIKQVLNSVIDDLQANGLLQ